MSNRSFESNVLRKYAKRKTMLDVISLFWERVDRKGVDECWEWKAGRNGKVLSRYGVFWVFGKKWKTHRFSFHLKNGPIPEGLIICHTCDNPPCCNPSHLFAGTHMDNKHDCISKGRDAHEIGEDRYNAKLTEKDIIEIRTRYRSRHRVNSGPALAREFGVVPSMIWSIIARKRWKHI